MVFALERFPIYAYGSKVTLLKDHKQLKRIIKKEFAFLPVRQQRLVARLLQYDFQLVFVPGKDMVLADFLSCQANSNMSYSDPKISIFDEQTPVDDAFIHDVDTIPIEDPLLSEIHQVYVNDPEIRATQKALREGWTNNMRLLIPQYRLGRKDIALGSHNLIYFNGRVLILDSLRPGTDELLDTCQTGSHRMLL